MKTFVSPQNFIANGALSLYCYWLYLLKTLYILFLESNPTLQLLISCACYSLCCYTYLQVPPVKEIRKLMRIHALRCHVIYCQNGRKINVIPVLGSRSQALRYILRAFSFGMIICLFSGFQVYHLSCIVSLTC